MSYGEIPRPAIKWADPACKSFFFLDLPPVPQVLASALAFSTGLFSELRWETRNRPETLRTWAWLDSLDPDVILAG